MGGREVSCGVASVGWGEVSWVCIYLLYDHETCQYLLNVVDSSRDPSDRALSLHITNATAVLLPCGKWHD